MNKQSEVKSRRARPQSNSTVSPKVLAFWAEKKEWGDSSLIQTVTGLSRPTIKAAFDGKATDQVIEKITNFYLQPRPHEKNEN